jgi:outer membrane lipoprotein SlyB
VKRALTATAVALSILVTGCAGTGAQYRPIVDVRPGQDVGSMELDLASCQRLAEQKASEAQAALVGAIGGAVLGIALGAALGGNSGVNTKLGGASAIMNGVGAAGQASQSRQAVVQRCMAGRGWSVVG